MKDTAKEQAALFSALADPTRLRLLKLLCNQHDPDALCVNALAGILGVTPPAVSQHLRVLKSVGMVKGDRRGNLVHYFADPEALRHVRELLAEATTLGEEEQTDRCASCEVKAK
jgi:DNA-binding transcriptional ArsR family regulator